MLRTYRESVPVTSSHDLMLERQRDGAAAGVDVQLGEDIGDVRGRGARADVERVRDLAGGFAFGQETKHVQLAVGEPELHGAGRAIRTIGGGRSRLGPLPYGNL